MKTTCCICGGETKPWLAMPIDPKTFHPIDYGQVVKCTNCGHGVLSPLPPPEKIESFYDLSKYYTQSGSHFNEFPLYFHDKVLTKLAWIFDKSINFDSSTYAKMLPSNSTICEIGCGHGRKLIPFISKGHTVFGVDPDKKAIKTAKKNGVDVFMGTAENLPDLIKDNTIDMIIMSHSLEHCIDPNLALRNVSKALKPNGLFTCEVPNSGCTHFIWNNICSEMFDVPRHIHFFNPESLKQAIESAGLKVESVAYCGFTRHFAKNWRNYEIYIRQNILKTSNAEVPPKHTFFRSLMLWVMTFMAKSEKKYDSVRINAIKI